MKQAWQNAPLSQWQGGQRAWGLGLLLLLGAGLLVALLYVHFSSTLGPQGLGARFSGPETETITPHTHLSLLQTTHTHLFTLAFLQALLGIMFLLSSAPRQLRLYLPGLTFVLVLLDHGAMWLLHLKGPNFSPVLMATGMAMTFALVLEWFWCLWDLATHVKRAK